MRSTKMKVPFDTLVYTQTLRQGGVNEKNANAHAVALTAALLQGVATSQDLDGVSQELSGKIQGLRDEMHTAIQGLREEMHTAINGLELQIQRLDLWQKWSMVVIILVIATTSPVALHIMKAIGLFAK